MTFGELLMVFVQNNIYKQSGASRGFSATAELLAQPQQQT